MYSFPVGNEYIKRKRKTFVETITMVRWECLIEGRWCWLDCTKKIAVCVRTRVARKICRLEGEGGGIQIKPSVTAVWHDILFKIRARRSLARKQKILAVHLSRQSVQAGYGHTEKKHSKRKYVFFGDFGACWTINMISSTCTSQFAFVLMLQTIFHVALSSCPLYFSLISDIHMCEVDLLWEFVFLMQAAQ